MGWKAEHKASLQSKYGGYCEMCRIIEKKPVPYHRFSPEEYNEVKEIYRDLINKRTYDDELFS